MHPTLHVRTCLFLARLCLASVACLFWSGLALAAPATLGSDTTAAQEASVSFINRDIVTFRSTLSGVSAADRARRAEARLRDQLDLPGPHKVGLKSEGEIFLVQIDGATTFFLTPADANRLEDETFAALSKRTTAMLELAIAESHESRNLQSMLRSLLKAGTATAGFVLLAWGLARVRQALAGKLMALAERRTATLQLAGVMLFHQKRLATFVDSALNAFLQLVLLLLAYEWLSFVLSSFPFTRAWGELLNDFLWGIFVQIGTAVARTIPGIFTALIIFYLAHSGGRLVDGLFHRIRSGAIKVSWIDQDVAEPTRRIAKAALWLFALAMAYPYLPGAHTDAFKGLSVLVGLMISLGSSNLVGQAASGLILTYGRVFRKGEYVRIGEHEGTVTELGMFATRMRTGMGEELTLANASVLSETTKNYSRSVPGPGFVLDTVVTIGYDTPWRQVHAMLEEAARRTVGVLIHPEPKVFQTALSDWYPQYRLVCQAIPSEPRPRAELLSCLHANIQDVFNEYGVQIMSPQYFSDPAAPKVVPPEKWFTAPAAEADRPQAEKRFSPSSQVE